MQITVGLLALSDGKVSCPNCERELLPERDVRFVKTLGSEKPRKAFATCFYCATSIEIAFVHEQQREKA